MRHLIVSLRSKARTEAAGCRCGRTKSWIKVKNPASPAMLRVHDGAW
jgi:hypothetical protein